MTELSFSESEFATLFPYFICINNAGIIESFGENLHNLCGIEANTRFADFFSWQPLNDKQPTVTRSLVPINEMISVRSVNVPNIVLNGKFEYMSKKDAFLFLGTPSYQVSNEHNQFQNQLINNNFKIKIHDNKYNFSKLKIENLDSLINYIKQTESTISREDNFAITVSNPEGNIIWCNELFEKMSGQTIEEVAGKRPRDAIYGKRSIFISKNFVDLNVQKGEPFYFENIGYTKHGSEFWFGVVVYPIFNTHFQTIGRIHLLKDISELKNTELKNEENANLLNLALEAARAGVWSIDLLTREVAVSTEYKNLIGIDKNHILVFNEVFFGIYDEDYQYYLNTILPGLNPQDNTFTFQHRRDVKGKLKYYSQLGKCLQWDMNGKPVKIVGTLRDITDEKLHLLELENQKKFYYSILDRIPADIAIWTKDHRYYFVNKNAIKNEEIRKWIIGKNDYEYCLYRGKDVSLADARNKQFLRALQTKKQQSYIESTTLDNEIKHSLRVFAPLFDDKGEVELIIGYGADVTEQVINEQYAIMQEEKLKSILDIAKDGIFVSDYAGNVSMANSAFLEIMESNATENTGLNFLDLLDATTQDIIINNINTLQSTGEVQSGMFGLTNLSTNAVKHIDYILIKDVKKDEGSFIGRLSDVTDIVMKEQNLQRTIAKEIQLNKYKTKFIHITSHELRTPLTIIHSNAEIIELLCENPELIKNKKPIDLVQRILKEVNVMTEILNQLMMIGKIESGNADIIKSVVNINEYVETVINSIFNPYSDGRYLKLEIQENIATWLFDPVLLKHALVNLLSNAFKYSRLQPPPILKISTDGNNLIFTVIDFGIGIPSEDRSSLFQSFYRASNVGVISGTGIGLLVVDYAVKKHGGTINLETEINKGTTFTITIPKY